MDAKSPSDVYKIEQFLPENEQELMDLQEEAVEFFEKTNSESLKKMGKLLFFFN